MSAQVDGHATEREQLDILRHLRDCAACRRVAAELRCLRADLQALEIPQPELPGPDLTLQIQAALQRENRLRGNPLRRRQDLIDLWLMRLFSQGIGTMVSLVLFVFVAMTVFKPAYRALALAHAFQQVAIAQEDEIDTAIRYRLLISPALPPPPFSPNEALLELGQSLPEDSQIIATVRVNSKNGRAELDQVVEQSSDPHAPSDPHLVSKLSSGLYQRASFQPLRRSEFTSRDAVLVFGKVNISASLD
jgi:hypothetical protein